MSPKQEFADAVAVQGALWRLLWVLERSDVHDSEETADNSKQHHAETQTNILRKQRGWSLLESLSSTPSIASKLVSSTAWLELLGILVGYSGFTKVWIARMGSAKTLSRLLWDPKTGAVAGAKFVCFRKYTFTFAYTEKRRSSCFSLVPLFQRFLPPTLVVVLKEEGPDVMLSLFDGESDTPELIWDGSMRAELRRVLAEELDRCIKERQGKSVADEEFTLSPSVRVKYTKLENELFVGGVYVSRFLKEPTYNLRDPTSFLENLLQRWTQEVRVFTSETSGDVNETANEVMVAGQDALQLVTNASVYLCKIRESLCDKLSQWGYMPRCLMFLDEILTKELVGTPLLSVMRLLHVAVNRRVNIETLVVSGQNDKKNGIVTFTIQAIGSDKLHPDSAFMIEMLKKVYSNALGDLKNAPKTQHTYPPQTTSYPPSQTQMHAQGENSQSFNAYAMAPSPAPGEGPVSSNRVSMGNAYQNSPNFHAYAMAPSPAPGEGPVSRNRVSMGNPLDDPLAMASPPPAAPPPNPGYGQNSMGGNQPSIAPTYQYATPSMNYASPLGAQTQNYQMMGAQPSTFPQQSNVSYNNTNAVNQMTYQGMSGNAGQPLQGTAQYASFQPNSYNMQQSQYQNYPTSAQPQALTSGNQMTPSRYGGQGSQGWTGQQSSAPAPSLQSQRTFQSPSGAAPSSAMGGVTGYPRYGSNEARQQPTSTSNRFQQQPVSNQPVQQQNAFQQTPQGGSLPQGQQPAFTPGVQQSPSYQHQTTNTPQPQQPGSSYVQQNQTNISPHGNFNTFQGNNTVQQQPPTSSMQQGYGMGSMQSNQGMQSQPVQQAQGGYQNSMQQNPHPAPHAGGAPTQQMMDHGQGVSQQQATGQGYPQPMNQQQVTYQGYNATSPGHQPGSPSGTAPMGQIQQPVFPSKPAVETVTEGDGIDARTKTSPKQEAEQRATTVPGAPGAADGRVALLQSALVCELTKFLVDDVLENPTLKQIKDPAAAKVHAVELVKLLTEDPGYGMKFQMVLDELPAWKKYKSQDHSLFITGPEQKSDYFLTDGSNGEPTKLLTQS